MKVASKNTYMRILVILIFVMPVLLLSSCGDGRKTVEVSSEIFVQMEGLAFNRRVIAVPAGERVVLRLKNTETYTHYFTVYETEKAENVIIEKKAIPAHTTTEYEFTAPEKTGRYYFQDDMFPSKMNGIFIVSDKKEVRVEAQ